MEAVFQAPKRRTRVYESFEGALPVCGGGELLRMRRAALINQHVIVREQQDILDIYGKGYFGKGILSRSRPQHNTSDRWKSVGDRRLPVVSSSQYQQHVSWAREALLSQGLDEDAVEETLHTYTHPWGVMGDTEEAEGAETSPTRQHESPAGKKPRYDPLAQLDHEQTLDRVKCPKHQGGILHCGCWPGQKPTQCPSTGGQGSNSEYQYVLVEEPEEDMKANNEPRALRLVCRINPFRIIEYLQLSLEEAFFLVYALGCLRVYNSNNEALSITHLWQTFSSTQPHFPTTYAAYHYFRSKGWVPKVGLKYGTDLLLYRKGPPFYHASYSVVVEKVDESFQGATLRPFSWRSLATLNRITGNVSKELMLCYVVWPTDTSKEEMSSPECVKRLRVQEIIVSRWISSRERAEQDEI